MILIVITPSNRYQLTVPALEPRGEIVIIDGFRADGLRMGVSVPMGYYCRLCMRKTTEFIG